MNDFTKEELQIIHLDMTIYAEKTKLLKESPSHKALRDKIQTMIDNYHNHEFTEYKDDVAALPHCKKCNQIIFGDFPCPCSLTIR